MYPPIVEATNAVSTKYKPVDILKVVAVMPEFGQGEIDEKPSALPSATSTRVNAAIAIAPAAIALQEVADWSESIVLSSQTLALSREPHTQSALVNLETAREFPRAR